MFADRAGRPIEILLVEDSPSDALMTREAFEQAKVAYKLQIVRDGAEALQYLRRQGKYADAVRPSLIILDLNLPGRNGREVLGEIKTDIALKTIPVVVLTTSKAEEDVNIAHRLHANCYVTKPVDFVKFSEVVQLIRDFWFGVVLATVLLGGLGSPFGALGAGLLIGVGEALTMATVAPSWAPVVPFTLLILILVLWPARI